MTPYNFQFQCFTAEILMTKPMIELDIKGRSSIPHFQILTICALWETLLTKTGKIITV